MTDKYPESNIPGRVTAPVEMLEPAINDLLRRIPETWEVYDPDSLTETQSQALFMLQAAGMVERRERLRVRMLDRKTAVEATITATGEYGAVEALEPLVEELWADWQSDYRKWSRGDRRETSPFHSERLSPSEWRLTDQGVLARKSLLDGEKAVVYDFVLKRGFFDGQPRSLPDGRVFRREHVRGKGSLVKVTKLTEGQTGAPGTVNIGNWGEGVSDFDKMLSSKFDALLSALKQVQPVIKKPAAKRRRRPAMNSKLKPLTEKQTEAVQIFGECQGNFAEAARRLGIDRKTFVERYNAACRKLGRKVVQRTINTKVMPTTRRGQESIAADGDGPAVIRENRSVQRDKRRQ
jgi:predicted DNA-binding protein (UPF0251 family)